MGRAAGRTQDIETGLSPMVSKRILIATGGREKEEVNSTQRPESPWRRRSASLRRVQIRTGSSRCLQPRASSSCRRAR